MRLAQIFLEQEEIIEKQAAIIRGLLYELMQFRTLTEEEQRNYLSAHKDTAKMADIMEK